MQNMKKILIRVGIALVALLVVLYLGRNFIARKAVEVGTEKVTGFPMEIGAVNVGILSGTLEVRDLKLMNPPEFHGGTFVDLPHFKLDYRTMSMLTGKPHINEVVVNVEQVVLVKNEKGETNANALQAKVTPASKESAAGEPATEAGKAKYQVDVVRVHVGTVIKKVYGKGQPAETKITLNQDIEIKDMNESDSITALVMQAALGPVAEVAGDVVKSVGDVTKGATDTIQKTGKGLFDTMKKVVPGQK